MLLPVEERDASSAFARRAVADSHNPVSGAHGSFRMRHKNDASVAVQLREAWTYHLLNPAATIVTSPYQTTLTERYLEALEQVAHLKKYPMPLFDYMDSVNQFKFALIVSVDTRN